MQVFNDFWTYVVKYSRAETILVLSGRLGFDSIQKAPKLSIQVKIRTTNFMLFFCVIQNFHGNNEQRGQMWHSPAGRCSQLLATRVGAGVQHWPRVHPDGGVAGREGGGRRPGCAASLHGRFQCEGHREATGCDSLHSHPRGAARY